MTTDVMNPNNEEVGVLPAVDNCCCTRSQDITFEVCEDVKDFTIQNVELNCVGRFLKVRVELDNICRGRTVAVGVLLCENVQGTFLTRGFKVREVFRAGSPGCVSNVTEEFCFVLPENNLCSRRTVRVNIVAHYSSFPSFPFCPC
ncbi:MAG: hypothetical protein PHV03_06390 [Desulfitobacteriaceae bacterium]|nr:hypothetical protein [Desulfitobacteriaceae bacterium]MDD4402581.1 hypothetical protein [Desulfitobacteriaceae bacterium]